MKPRIPQRFEVTTGMYPSVNSLMDEITLKVPIAFSYNVDEIDQKMTLDFNEGEGLTFQSSQLPSILGFNGMVDGHGSQIHIGYKQIKFFETNHHVGDFLVDITSAQILLLFIQTSLNTSTLVTPKHQSYESLMVIE